MVRVSPLHTLCSLTKILAVYLNYIHCFLLLALTAIVTLKDTVVEDGTTSSSSKTLTEEPDYEAMSGPKDPDRQGNKGKSDAGRKILPSTNKRSKRRSPTSAADRGHAPPVQMSSLITVQLVVDDHGKTDGAGNADEDDKNSKDSLSVSSVTSEANPSREKRKSLKGTDGTKDKSIPAKASGRSQSPIPSSERPSERSPTSAKASDRSKSPPRSTKLSPRSRSPPPSRSPPRGRHSPTSSEEGSAEPKTRSFAPPKNRHPHYHVPKSKRENEAKSSDSASVSTTSVKEKRRKGSDLLAANMDGTDEDQKKNDS